jgi:hypothetical protein
MTTSNLLTYVQKDMKTICKVIWDKTIDHKSCGTILEGAPHEKCGECAKVKINAF